MLQGGKEEEICREIAKTLKHNLEIDCVILITRNDFIRKGILPKNYNYTKSTLFKISYGDAALTTENFEI